MLSNRSVISSAFAFVLTMCGTSYGQTPPPDLQRDLQTGLLMDLSADLGKEWSFQNPPRPPRVPSPPNPPREPRAPRGQDGRPEVTEPFSRNFKVAANSTLVVTNTRGNIFVSAGAAGQIDVSATKRARGTGDEPKRRLAETQIEVYLTANRVELRAEPDRGDWPDRGGPGRGGAGRGGVSVDFEIKVPPDCAVDLRSVSADIRVTNVKGELRAQAVSGDVTLEGTSRIAAIKTVSGDVLITNGGGDASFSVSTVSGDLATSGLNARAVDLNTVNGDYRLIGWTGERVTGRSLSGNFEINGSLVKGGRYDFESHSGDVRLVLADQPGFEIEANTFSGSIGIDFSIKSEGPVRTGNNRNPRTVRGTYGDGSASVRVQTFSGDILLSRK